MSHEALISVKRCELRLGSNEKSAIAALERAFSQKPVWSSKASQIGNKCVLRHISAQFCYILAIVGGGQSAAGVQHV